jgi:hypothetical protein
MTNSELNRDIKRLYKSVKTLENTNNEKFFDAIQNESKKEFTRLYFADKKAEFITKDSLLKMMVLNRRYCFIAFHNFYIQAEPKF